MLNIIDGIYRNLKSNTLATRGIDESRALDLRDRLVTFVDDWNSLEMDIYDD